MFDHDTIHQRGKALEDEFFHRVDEDLRAKLRDSLHREDSKRTLAEMTGFEDDKLLDHLIEAGFEPITVAALGLVPLVFVAWADGRVTEHEREAVMSEALSRGLSDKPEALKMIQHWLTKKPASSLWTTWSEYVQAVLATTPTNLAELLRRSLMTQARTVAKASGGVLGMHRICREEQELLDQMQQVLDPANESTQPMN